MLVPNIPVVLVSTKLMASKLQVSNAVEERSLKKNSNTHSSIELMKEIVTNGSLKRRFLSNIFPVQFIYLQKLIRTKVMKVNNGFDNPLYKVVLTTLLHNSASLWWLQHQPNGWATLLGPKLNDKLTGAITSAIECHELLVTK